MFDIVNSCLMISYILMYIGVSQSINRAFKAQYRRRMRSTSNTFVTKSENVSKIKAVVSINESEEEQMP
jgi:hypothetical protein